MVEERISAPYTQYVRGYIITTKDKLDNEKEYRVDNISVQNNNLIITNAQELQDFATSVNNGTTYSGLTVQLGKDIDLNGVTNFTPIGTSSSKSFQGTFQGNGYTISNMTISKNENYAGLFGYVGEGATIENVKIENYSIKGNKAHVGGLAGYNKGTISKVSTNGTISNGQSSNTAAYVGGLVGSNYGTIEKCYTEGKVTSGGTLVGGLVGKNNSGGKIRNCYSTAEIKGYSSVGGLVGNNLAAIETSYAIGKVTATGTTTNIGGLVGSSSGTITDSYWNKETSGVEESEHGTSVLFSALTQKALYPKTWKFSDVWEIQDGETCPYLKDFGDPPEGMKNILNGYTLMTGIGTKDNPYKISTEKQLNLIHDELEACYELEKDIKIEEITNWIPIGESSSKYFAGTFKGNGHTISNIAISRSENYTGLFGYVEEGATIENVKIENYSIKGNKAHVGGLAGYNKGTISKVSTNGTISNGQSSNTAAYVGGLVGSNYGTIEKCYTEGKVTSGGTLVGGLVGKNNSGGKIRNCYSTAEIKGYSSVGGLVGNNLAAIETSYAIGKVTATGTTTNIGGLVGSSSGTITDSYWDTETSGETKSKKGTGYTTTEMQTKSNYSNNWDFNKVWEWVDNNYPKLR